MTVLDACFSGRTSAKGVLAQGGAAWLGGRKRRRTGHGRRGHGVHERRVDGAGEGPAPEAFSETGPRIKRGAVTKVSGDFTVDARPRPGVRLELTDPEGRTQVTGAPYKNAQAAVGRWRVVARAQGYSEERREVEVLADELTVEKVELKRLGGLEIRGSPAGRR